MIPIKSLMVACLVLMLLQGISIVFKQIAILRGEPLGGPPSGASPGEPDGGPGSGALDEAAPARTDAAPGVTGSGASMGASRGDNASPYAGSNAGVPAGEGSARP